MTADVIEFTPKREYVWEHRCVAQGQTFFLHRDGSVQCQGCNELIPDLVWGKRSSQEKQS